MRHGWVVMMALLGCQAPKPCVRDTDCPAACINGACIGPDLSQEMDATPDAARDAQGNPPDQRMADSHIHDAAPDQTVDHSVDQMLDQAVDAGSDARPPCESDGEFELRIDAVDQPALRRGDVFSFDVTVPEGVMLEVEAPYGAFQREDNRFEWAPRGGAPGDLPTPWWTGSVDLTIRGEYENCVVERRIEAQVVGDVLIADRVTGAIWVIGSGGRLLTRWVDVPGGGISAMTYLPRRRHLLVGVREPDDAGRHLIHHLDETGTVINTFETVDFGAGTSLLNAPALGIAALPNNRVLATSGQDEMLSVWSVDGELEARLTTDGPVEHLRRWDQRAALTANALLYTSEGAGLPRSVTRTGIEINGLYEHQDPGRLLAIAGPSWDQILQYGEGQFSNLPPPLPGTDIRALTPFGDGYLSYDSRNRRIRQHDAQMRVGVLPEFAADVRGLSVGTLLWLDQTPRIANPD